MRQLGSGPEFVVEVVFVTRGNETGSALASELLAAVRSGDFTPEYEGQTLAVVAGSASSTNQQASASEGVDTTLIGAVVGGVGGGLLLLLLVILAVRRSRRRATLVRPQRMGAPLVDLDCS